MMASHSNSSSPPSEGTCGLWLLPSKEFLENWSPKSFMVIELPCPSLLMAFFSCSVPCCHHFEICYKIHSNTCRCPSLDYVPIDLALHRISNYSQDYSTALSNILGPVKSWHDMFAKILDIMRTTSSVHNINTAALITVVHMPSLFPSADCVKFCVL